ncbi:hypothetical protein LTR53_011060 [Teratosphaeriaceae sp. CCFEE 6253]|nr:hypothetical protein LTR53_011060 [Teratosphaeriaceae sp. CCFEE 6253]
MRRLWITAAIAAAITTGLGQADSANSTTPIVAGEFTVHTITVGKVPNKYDPNSIIATPGDIVTFEFWSGNHSTIRAAYGYGMVGVINPSINTSLNTQIELSSQAAYMLAPGQAIPEDALQSMSSLAATATTATVTVTATGSATTAEASEDPNEYYPNGVDDDDDDYATTSATPAPTSPAPSTTPKSSSSSSLSPGAIAGIAVGGVAFLAIAAALFFFLGRTTTMKDELNRLRGRPSPPTGDGGEAAGFMAAHTVPEEKHDSGGQLPPYRYPSPEMKHGEYPGMKEVSSHTNPKDAAVLSSSTNKEQHRSVYLQCVCGV